MTMSRKAKILAASFLAALLLVLSGFSIQGHMRAAAYRQMLSQSYQHAFAELATAMNELDTALQKSVYATSPTLISTLCTQIFGKTVAAQMAIGELPYGNVELEQTAAFIAKTGDYAAALSRTAALNGGYSDQEREALQALADNASQLSQLLNELEGQLFAGTLSLEDVAAAEQRLSAQSEGSEIWAGSAFQTIESDFPELPTLIYDGPFSEHLSSRAPSFLEGRGQVTPEDAQKAAAVFLDLKPSVFTLSSSSAGRVPTYGFSAVVDGGETYVEVTCAGGLVSAMRNARPVAEATLSRDAALQKASSFLEQQGYSGMKATYDILQDNTLVVNYAAVEDGILCYPDLIKVAVALDNGRIVGFEAAGYLMNHTTRALPPATVTPEEAQAVVSPDLTVLSSALALIPTGGENEILCYEFKCQTSDEAHCIVYVNAYTGIEEKILLLLEDESGTLAI